MKLQIARFDPHPGALPVQMADSDGTAMPLVKLNEFGADLIRFAPGKRVGLHTHQGDHILVVVSGTGVLTFRGERHALYAGVVYLVPGSVPHAIDAETELSIIAVGNDHRDAGAEDRLEVV